MSTPAKTPPTQDAAAPALAAKDPPAQSAAPQVLPLFLLRRPTVPPSYYTTNGGWHDKISAGHEFASIDAALRIANQIHLSGVEVIAAPLPDLTQSGAVP